MTAAVVLVVLVAFLVWLSIARPSLLHAVDREDRERQLAELRAMPGYRNDDLP